MKWLNVPTVVILSFWTSAMHGAGFDCKAAVTEVEKMICADDALSAADYALSHQYKVLLAVSSNESTLKDSQRAWLNERNRCKETKCLLTLYQDRREALQKRLDQLITRASIVTSDEYFDSAEITAYPGKQVLGKYHSCVKIRSAGPLAMVHFEVYFPDSGQILESEAPAVIAGKEGFSFNFVDGWYNQSRAKVTTNTKGLKLELDVVESASDFSAKNIHRQYGEYSLAKKSCVR